MLDREGRKVDRRNVHSRAALRQADAPGRRRSCTMPSDAPRGVTGPITIEARLYRKFDLR
jgi:hypothetical protein